MNTARTILSALALACASMAANAVTVDFSASTTGDADAPGITYDVGQFSGVDTNTDGWLTKNELSSFTANGWGSSLTLSTLNLFGSYNIATNYWISDAGGYYYGGSDNSFAYATNWQIVTTTVVPNAVPTAPVPEPETYAMMMAGLGVLGWMGRRRQAKKA